MSRTVTTTSVGIVGGGPAGLMLSHLLHHAGIDSVVIETRTRREIEETHRAGILERDSVRLLVDSGVSDRVLREGHEHRGIQLRFGGVSHLIDFQELVGASTWLYPQTDVFIDLAVARERDGGDVRYAVSDTSVVDITTDRPGMLFTDADGIEHEVRCDILVGADGSRSMTRSGVVDRKEYFRQYPFAWFGILCEAPPSSPELVYTRSERGFALISQRTDTIQRMYFQCSPDESVDQWSEDRIWSELQARVAGEDGFTLNEGRIFDKTVLPFRSYVCEPMRHGNLLLAGDAAHTVPAHRGQGAEPRAGRRTGAVRGHRDRGPQARPGRAGRLHRKGAVPRLEGAALLVLDDHHAPPVRQCLRLRRTPTAGRAVLGRVVRARLPLPGRGLHRLAGLSHAEPVEPRTTSSVGSTVGGGSAIRW